MIPVVNRPFLQHMLDYLRRHGITDVVLSMCYRPQEIEQYFGDGGAFGIDLTYVVEDSPLGTAGGVKNVEQHIDGTCLVFNGDILTDLDLGAMLEAHRQRGAVVSIALTPVEDPTAYGLVETDADGRVLGFVEKPSWDRVTTNLINAGTYIVEKDVLRHVPDRQFYMFEHGLFPTLVQLGAPVFGYPSDAYWIDIGTPEKYINVHRDLLSGKVAIKLNGKELRDGVWVDDRCDVDPSASLTGPIVLGRGITVGPGAIITGPVVVGDGCRIGRGAHIEDAIIWQDTSIGNHVTMKNCVVAKGCDIQDGSSIAHGAIVSDGCRIGSANKLERGIRIWPDKTIEPGAITF